MKKIFIRTTLILGWIFLIFGILYFPNFRISPTEEKTLNIFAWSDTLDPKVLKEFEMETKIKVNLSFYSSNEELQMKMKATA